MIRPLREDDVAEVAAVLGLARLHQRDGTYLVAWEGVAPVGHLHLTATDPPEVQDLEVATAWRRRGVATLLVAEAARRCRARGDQRLQVEVGVENAAARALYEQLGFRATDRPPRRVVGTVELRTGPIDVDDTLLELALPLST